MSFLDGFRDLRKHVSKHGHGREACARLLTIVSDSATMLKSLRRVSLTSSVVGKQYFSWEAGSRLSRAVNCELYESAQDWLQVVERILRNDRSGLTDKEITASLYAGAVCFCAATDLLKERDQKTPGTFFEYYSAALLHAVTGVHPVTSLDVLNLDLATKLPTDLVFNLGMNKAKLHVPVKTSTRERIIQVWAHQRVLDGAYGTGRFLGCPIILGETKTDTRRGIVTEICLPDQWQLYQMHIAQLWQVVYLDLPEPYRSLNDSFPCVSVISAGEFLRESGILDTRILR